MLYGVEAQQPPGVPAQPIAAGAVHFAGSKQGDGTTYLLCNSLSCTDNGFFSFSFWTNDLCTAANNLSVFWVVDPDGDYIIEAQTFTFGGNPGCLFFEYGTTASSSDISFSPLDDATVGWRHVLGSSDINKASGTQIMSVYIDDVLQTPLGVDYGPTAASNPINGKKFIFGDDTTSSGPTCDFADVWIAPGVKLHETDGTILTATRRQFITADLAPADPNGFPTSAILFSGDASSFATNRGTGGAFTLTGSLTNAATVPP